MPETELNSVENDHYRISVLDNGLTVVTESLPYVRSVAFGVWSKAGSRDEAPESEGAAHFLEHMFFKGTERRSAFDIAYELERLGGYLNAFTAKDHTCYYTHLLDEHLAVAVDVLGDMIQNARFDADELEKEKQVVREEIRTSIDTPDDWIHELFLMDLYGEHPLAHPVLGREDTVSSLTRDDLLEFISRRYRPESMLIGAAGSLDHDQVVELAAGNFSKLNAEPAEPRESLPPVPAGTEVPHARDISQIHVISGCTGLPYNHEDRYALVILLNLLAGGMSSRLFQSLREERGLVYTISSASAFYEETGLAAFYFACAPENVRLSLDLIFEEIGKVGSGNSIGDEELKGAKEQVKGHIMLALESTFNRMSRLAKGLLFEGRIISIEETIRNIDAVTAGDMVRLCNDLLVPGGLTTTMLGAVPGNL